MEEDKNLTIPYFAHEGMMVRAERTNHRLWILCIVLIVSLIATNLAWILYEAQWEVYEEEQTTQEVYQTAESDTGNAVNRFVGGDYVQSNADDENDNN